MMDDCFHDGFFERLDRYHDSLDEHFKKLFLDSSANVPESGDTVVVAAGLIGRGHQWIRKEAKVLQVAESSVQVQFPPSHYDDGIEWIHPALITDVISKR